MKWEVYRILSRVTIWHGNDMIQAGHINQEDLPEIPKGILSPPEQREDSSDLGYAERDDFHPHLCFMAPNILQVIQATFLVPVN